RACCRARAKVGGEGRVRTSVARWAADLQSAAIDRSATSPLSRRSLICWSPCFRRVPEDPLRTMNSGAGGGRGSLRWSWRRDLNPRPADYKSAALPDLAPPARQRANYSTSRASNTIPARCQAGLFSAFASHHPPLSDGLEQHYACGDRYVQTANVPTHRNGRQSIATLPHQTSQAGSFGSEDQRGWERQVDGVIGVRCFCSESDGPAACLFQFPSP